MERSAGSSTPIRQKRVSVERYQSWLRFGGGRGNPPRIFTRSTSSARALMPGSAVSLEGGGGEAQDEREEEDGRAHPYKGSRPPP
jgi:hypothetical protein